MITFADLATTKENAYFRAQDARLIEAMRAKDRAAQAEPGSLQAPRTPEAETAVAEQKSKNGGALNGRGG
jgi:hypothetical protein